MCSAHPLVLLAALEHARETGGVVLIEATSNQVDQTGGYTGMRPEDFRELVLGLAEQVGLPQRRRRSSAATTSDRTAGVGGPPDEAMRHADDLVEAYVRAGFTKIHLDCSFVCAGDPSP